MSTNLNPQIYVACLASYNNGRLFGEWIDATLEPALIQEEIFNMLAKSPVANAEEFAIHDYEDFGCICLDEYESISNVHEIAIFIQEHGELGAELYAFTGDLKDSKYMLENNYHGEHDSELNFAIQLFEDCYMYEVPKAIQYYIDYDAFRRDLFSSDYCSVNINGSVHVFSNY